MFTHLMYLTLLSVCSGFASAVLPIHANAAPELKSPKEGLRNPFDYALPPQHLLSDNEQLRMAKLALQSTIGLANWQINDLVLVGTVATDGVFQGLVKDPRNMIHVISLGDIVTKARLKVSAVEPEAVLLFSESFEFSERSKLKEPAEQAQQPKDNRGDLISLKLRHYSTSSEVED